MKVMKIKVVAMITLIQEYTAFLKVLVVQIFRE